MATKKCIICKRPFESYDYPKKHRENSPIRRPFRAVTCSPICSKTWTRRKR